MNVASLLLARGAARRQELAIRLSLGAGRGRLVQQLLVETALLSLVGVIFGLILREAMAAAVEDLQLPVADSHSSASDARLARDALCHSAGHLRHPGLRTVARLALRPASTGARPFTGKAACACSARW